MALISVKCINCGGEIQLDEKKEFGYCSSCGSKVMVEQAITNINHMTGNVIVDGNVQIVDNRQKIERETKMKRIKVTFEKAKTGIYWVAEKNAYSYECLYEAEIGVDGTRKMGYGLIQKLCTDILNVDPEDGEAYYYRALSCIETCNYYFDFKPSEANNFYNLSRPNIINDCSSTVRYAVGQEKENRGNILNHALLILDEKSRSTRTNVNKGACYIATAVYGSYDATEVLVLRRYRDDVLNNTTIGRVFISVYYKWSPKFAGKLKEWETVNRFAKTRLNKLVCHLKEKYNY